MSKWKHLEEKSNRGEKIALMLWWYIKTYGANILDINCGLAPVNEPLYDMEERFYIPDYLRYFGFDHEAEFILSNSEKHGSFQLCKDDEYEHPKGERVDILMLLGICSGNHEHESKTEVQTLFRLIDETKPKVVVVEITEDTPKDHWDEITEKMSIRGDYEKDFEAIFETDMSYCAERRLKIYIKKHESN